MADGNAVHQRVEELARQLQLLSQKVEQLERRLDNDPVYRPSAEMAEAAVSLAVSRADAANAPEDVSEEILNWASKAALLPRLSTLCFLLVAALLLRTITDNNIINTLLGSALGMGYAATLIFTGWYRYSRKNQLAPVFAACGAVLMSIIVVETHTRFQSLPLVPAYMTLMATGVAMAATSYRFNVFLPISLGTLGMCFAGAAIDYPNPFFPYLIMVIWTANVLGFFAARLKKCSWLRWTVLAVTIMMLSQWGIKLGQVLFAKGTPPPALAENWFLPVIAAFALTYAGIALLGIIRDTSAKTTRFDFFVPALSAAFTYSIAWYVVLARGASTATLGWAAIACSAAHFYVAYRLAARKTAAGAGTNSFILAGSTLLALALAAVTGSFLLSLPAVAVTAFFLIIFSRQWDNYGTRLISYALQCYAAAALAIFLQNSPAAAVDLLTVIPAGLLAVISLYHYQLSRYAPAPADSGFFSRFDRHDISAVSLLLAALTSGFFMFRAAVYQVIVAMPGDRVNSFRCTQSILINITAAVLILFAVRRRSKEIRNVAILVTLVGAIKVFLYDMIGTHGVPLVLSVFTFGLVAAVESVVLGRWPRSQPELVNEVAMPAEAGCLADPRPDDTEAVDAMKMEAEHPAT